MTESLTLAMLAENVELGLTILNAPRDMPPVSGTYESEARKPENWLPPGYLLLSEGHLLAERAAERLGLKSFCEALVHAGCAGLLVRLNHDRTDLLTRLVDACREVGLAFACVRPDMPFSTIETAVRAQLSTQGPSREGQLLWMQAEFLHAASSSSPLPAVLTRLGRYVDGEALIFDPAGNPARTTNQAPQAQIWQHLENQSVQPQRFCAGDWHVAAHPLHLAGALHWLVIAARSELTLDTIGEVLLATAQRVLEAVDGVASVTAYHADSEATQLLKMLGAGVSALEVPQVWERLRAFSFVSHERLRLMAWQPADRNESGQLTGTLRNMARLHRVPVLIKSSGKKGRDSLEVALVQEGNRLDIWLDSITFEAAYGFSSPLSDITLAPHHVHEAERALQVALEKQGAASKLGPQSETKKHIVRFETIDLATWLISGQRTEDMRQKVLALYGELFDNPDLRDTVLAYLRHNLEITSTAEDLFVHPNTVRYRLRQVERIIGQSIPSPAAISNLYLAFHNQLPAVP